MILLLLLLITPALTKNEKINIPLVISTWGSSDFQKANAKGFNSLRVSRMYGLVEGLTVCEKLQCDTTVGFGGSPDENGETTLDAMLFDSPQMSVGAVADLRRIESAAQVAWAVMNYTKHTLIVGDSATQFAKQMGFPEKNLTTDDSIKMHADWKNNKCQPNFWRNVYPNPQSSCGPYQKTSIFQQDRYEFSNKINEFNHDTLGMVVIDQNGIPAAGTSTNGASHKIPGRVGDSPIPGAGAYANSIGAAAATGDGDIMMRFLPSYEVVRQMTLGTKPFKACRKAMLLILAIFPDFQGAIVAANNKGAFGASCANLKKFQFVVTDQANTTVHTVACLPEVHPRRYKNVVKYPLI